MNNDCRVNALGSLRSAIDPSTPIELAPQSNGAMMPSAYGPQSNLMPSFHVGLTFSRKSYGSMPR